MTSLYSFGLDPRAFYSQSLGSESSDLVSFVTLPQPMPEKTILRSVATNGVNWLAVGAGGASYTLDPTTAWSSYSIYNGWVNFNKVRVAQGTFFAVGSLKNSSTLEEQACVFSTTSGGDSSMWQERYQNPGVSSGYFDLAHLGGGELVAVGYQSTNLLPLISYSADAITWINLPVDSLPGAVFSVDYDNGSNTIWVGGQGWTATGSWNSGGVNWTISSNLLSRSRPKAITAIGHDATHVVAISGSTVWTSNNGVDWTGREQAGYTFSSLAKFQQTWVFGCESLLQQYTGFSLDLTSSSPQLKGFNSGVQAAVMIEV